MTKTNIKIKDLFSKYYLYILYFNLKNSALPKDLSFEIAVILIQLLTRSDSDHESDLYEKFLEKFIVLLFLKEKKLPPSKKHWKKKIHTLKISDNDKLMILSLIEISNLNLTTQIRTLGVHSSDIFNFLNIRPPEFINTNRLTIRKTSLEFSQLTFQIVQNQKSRLSKYLSWVDKIQSIEDQNKFIKKAQLDWSYFTALHYQIFHNEKLIGAISIHSINFLEKSFQYGYWIEEKSIGNGFAAESIQTLNKIMKSLGWAYSLLKIRKDNDSSLRIAEKLDYELIPDRQMSDSQFLLYSNEL